MPRDYECSHIVLKHSLFQKKPAVRTRRAAISKHLGTLRNSRLPIEGQIYGRLNPFKQHSLNNLESISTPIFAICQEIFYICPKYFDADQRRRDEPKKNYEISPLILSWVTMNGIYIPKYEKHKSSGLHFSSLPRRRCTKQEGQHRRPQLAFGLLGIKGRGKESLRVRAMDEAGGRSHARHWPDGQERESRRF